MGRIVYLMGKSSTGKDTIYKELINNRRLGLKAIVPYTTRPIRDGETDGVEYHFVEEREYLQLKERDQIIEERAYQTFHGLWRYFTVDDENMELDRQSYVMIGTLESYQKTRDHFGADQMLPILIELDDGERLMRAVKRERKQEKPRYEELCRRFLADSEDFSEEKIKAAGVELRLCNHNSRECSKEIEKIILAACGSSSPEG